MEMVRYLRRARSSVGFRLFLPEEARANETLSADLLKCLAVS
jgi:hypothetical protein